MLSLAQPLGDDSVRLHPKDEPESDLICLSIWRCDLGKSTACRRTRCSSTIDNALGWCENPRCYGSYSGSALAFLIGFFMGLRFLTPPAVTAWAAHLGWLKVPSPLSWIGTTAAGVIFTIFALVELVTDKLPKTPSRAAAEIGRYTRTISLPTMPRLSCREHM